MTTLNRVAKRLSPRQRHVLSTIRGNVIYGAHFLWQGMWRSLVPSRSATETATVQSLLTFEARNMDAGSPEQLRSYFEQQGLKYAEGNYTFYLPPQEKLTQLLPHIVAAYPPTAGFKILKDFRSPDQSNYLNSSPLAVRRHATGSSIKLLQNANYLYDLKLGPRAWDVCCWQTAHEQLTVFVVDHVYGVAPTPEQYNTFIKDLSRAVSETSLRVSVPKWETTIDFRAPDCNGNLLYDPVQNKAQYVDFQNFTVTDAGAWTKSVVQDATGVFHFGQGRPFQGKQYLYQSIPSISKHGKRSTEDRWDRLDALLQQSGIDLQNRLVLDIGCNSGLMMYSALGRGALWGLGWDKPDVAANATRLLLSLGASRFGLTGAMLNSSYNIGKDIPAHLLPFLPEAVVLYLSVHQHVGFSEALKEMPWKVLIFEGHQGETLEDIRSKVTNWLGASLKFTTEGAWADGDSTSRPLVIALKS